MRPEDFLKINADNLSSIAASTNSAMQGIVRSSENHGKTLLQLQELEQQKELETARIAASKEESLLRATIDREQISATATAAAARTKEYNDRYDNANRAKLADAATRTVAGQNKYKVDVLKLELDVLSEQEKRLSGAAAVGDIKATLDPSKATANEALRLQIQGIGKRRADIQQEMLKIGEQTTQVQLEAIQQMQRLEGLTLPVQQGGDMPESGDGPVEPMGELLLPPLEDDEVAVPPGGEHAKVNSWMGVVPGGDPVPLRPKVVAGITTPVTRNTRVSSIVPAVGVAGDAGPSGEPEAPSLGIPEELIRNSLASVKRLNESNLKQLAAAQPARNLLGITSYPVEPGSTVHLDFPDVGVPMANIKEVAARVAAMDKDKQGEVRAELESELRRATAMPISVATELAQVAAANTLPTESMARAAADLVVKDDPESLVKAKAKLNEGILANTESLQKAIMASHIPEMQKAATLVPMIKHQERAARETFAALVDGRPVPRINPAMDAVTEVYQPKVVDRLTGESWDNEGAYRAAKAAKAEAAQAEVDNESRRESLAYAGMKTSKITDVLLAQMDQAANAKNPNSPTPFGVTIKRNEIDAETGAWKDREGFERRVMGEYADYSERKMLEEIANVVGKPSPDRVKAGYKSPNLVFDVKLKNGVPDPDGEWMSKTRTISVREEPGPGETIHDATSTHNRGALFTLQYGAWAPDTQESQQILLNIAKLPTDARRKATLYLFSKMTSAYADDKLSQYK